MLTKNEKHIFHFFHNFEVKKMGLDYEPPFPKKNEYLESYIEYENYIENISTQEFVALVIGVCKLGYPKLFNFYVSLRINDNMTSENFMAILEGKEKRIVYDPPLMRRADIASVDTGVMEFENLDFWESSQHVSVFFEFVAEQQELNDWVSDLISDLEFTTQQNADRTSYKLSNTYMAGIIVTPKSLEIKMDPTQVIVYNTT